MSLKILKEIAASLQAAIYFTIMVDETTDAGNKEQVVFVFWWVDDDLQVHRDFLGLHSIGSTISAALVSLISDTLLTQH